tara:strand:+ start:343 stop:756 length:414 start_codon:yes stop_codon:yes gene_type:complete
MYHHSESMVSMLEDMQRNASAMEAEVKMMLEMEGRAMGIELDRRSSARNLMEQLSAHIEAQTVNNAAMTWAYVNEEECNYDCAMPEDYIPASTDYIMEDHTYMDPMGEEDTMPSTEPMDGPMDASIEDINPNPENAV